ncbi:hypothetical protein OEZ86_003839 [Tetradesmus obliquus]|nr:hypothetical protein OEZ86_003839 [Tetradesmus obliquus]
MLGLARLWHIVLLVRARLEARAVGNFRLRIALLLGFSVANVGFGALLYKLASGPGAVSTEDALFTVYSVLYSVPGADITHASSRLATIVLNMIFLFGLLVFATILAMITEEVNSMLLDVRCGKAPLAMSGHILLLNWNRQVPFLLDQLQQVQHGAAAGRHPFAGRPLVILADAAKDDIDAAVLSFMRHHKQLEVHTRSGKPYRPEHLQRVSAATAAAVLVLHPEALDSSTTTSPAKADSSSSGAAALRLQSLMALAAVLLGRKVPVVVQVPECGAGCISPRLSALGDLLGLAGQSMTLHQLPVQTIISSLAVQTAIQPWTATVFHHILQHGLQPHLAFTPLPDALFSTAARTAARSQTSQSAEAATRAATQQEGTVAYRDAAAQCGVDAVVLGFFSSSRQQLQLNPPDSSRLEPGDALVVLTRTAGHKQSHHWLSEAWHATAAAVLPALGLSGKRSDKGTASAAAVRRHDIHKLKILVAGYTIEEAANDLLPLLLEFAPAGSSVVVALPRAEHDAAAAADSQQQQQQQQQLPEGLEWEGQLEAEEEPQQPGGIPVMHCISYRFLEVGDPTSSDGLAAAGLLEADALLLAPDAEARSSPAEAEADAHVLGTMLEVQHLMACVQRQDPPAKQQQQQQQQQQPARRLGSWESRVANQLLTAGLVRELLGSAEGCELYMLPPTNLKLYAMLISITVLTKKP